MAITIPRLPQSSIEITLNSLSTDQKPYLGGPVQRIARMGDKWSVKVDARPMHARQAGPIVVALMQGLSDKVVFEVRQSGVDLSDQANGIVSGNARGRSLTIAEEAGQAKFVGQFFNVVKNGVHYLHQITAVSGRVLSFYPMLKVALTGGETLIFNEPKIEGFLSQNTQGWTVGMVANLGVSFTITEAQ